MLIPTRQQGFHRGEVAPEYWGRTNTAAYQYGLKLCRNWVPLPHGSAESRPGTLQVDTVRLPQYKPLIRSFIYSDGQKFVLEFSSGALRFYKDGLPVLCTAAVWSNSINYAKGAQVSLNGSVYQSTVDDNLNVSPDLPGTAWWVFVGLVGDKYEIATPYLWQYLPYLKLTQVGDVITITYGGQVAGDGGLQPRTLTRVGDTNWVLALLSFSAEAWFGYPVQILYTNAEDLTPPNWADSPTAYTKGDYVLYNGKLFISLQSANIGHKPDQDQTDFFMWWSQAADTARMPKPWRYAITQIFFDVNGQIKETALGTNPATGLATPVGSWVRSSDRPLMITWALLPNMDIKTKTGTVLLGYNIYAGVNGVYGLIGVAGATATIFTDPGVEPDYTQQPPTGEDPFLVATGSNQASGDYYPAVPFFFEQRRGFARSAKKPMTFWLSKTGYLSDFSRPLIGRDDNAIEFALAASLMEEVRAAVPLQHLCLFTAQGVWRAQGAGGGPLTRTSPDVKKQNHHGASWLQPLVVGDNEAIYNTVKGGKVRNFKLINAYYGTYQSTDLSIYGRHLLKGHTLSDWAMTLEPYPVLWASRDDGVLLTLTYDPEQEALAWAQHTINFGTVESLCAVPEGTEDVIYMVVQRTIDGVQTRYIERVSNWELPLHPVTGDPDVRYAVRTDCAKIYDGHNTGATTMWLTGASFNGGDQIALHASVGGTFVVGDVGDSIVFDPDDAAVECEIIDYTDNSDVVVRLNATLTAQQIIAWTDTARTTSWAWARKKFSVPHLAGVGSAIITDDGQATAHGVTVLADGYPIRSPDAGGEWFGGQLTLAQAAVVVVVGISYFPDLELLDLLPTDAIRTSFKAVKRLDAEIYASRGLFFGEDFDTLEEWEQRDVGDDYAAIPLTTDYVEVFIRSEWNKYGRAVFRQVDPLPITLISVTREIELAGK